MVSKFYFNTSGSRKNGYLKYVDFSYSNAYDVLSRPFNQSYNSLAQGETTKDSLMKALGNRYGR